jgi:glycosyltransferase involved in cell wall biosynthesis
MRAALHQPSSSDLDGLKIEYLRYLSPPRPWSYTSWGAWAAPALAARLRRLRRSFRFDLVHAHYAVPAGDAVRRAAPRAPLLVSVHGHDVYGKLASSRTVGAALAHARIVLANSAGTARRSCEQGARATRVVHLGADVPPTRSRPPVVPTIVTVGNLIARKRHADVIAAVAQLRRERHPGLRYVIVGDGPERTQLHALADTLGITDAIEFRGQLAHEQAVAVAQSATVFALPSAEEAFGVAYVEAMGAGVPAVGCRGEDGPEEIAAAGGGIVLVPAGNRRALAAKLDEPLSDPATLEAAGSAARATVEREFSWEKCGRETVHAYADALAIQR